MIWQTLSIDFSVVLFGRNNIGTENLYVNRFISFTKQQSTQVSPANTFCKQNYASKVKYKYTSTQVAKTCKYLSTKVSGH